MSKVYECKWDEDNWRSLLNAISQQKCILMLGPEVSLEQSDNQPVACTEALARELASKITDSLSSWNINLDTSNLAQVSQYFYMIKEDRFILEDMVSSFYRNRQNLTSELHQNLSALPFPLTITSTPDNMFYNALKEYGKSPVIERYHFSEPAKSPIMVDEMNFDIGKDVGTEKEPIIFHLFGTIKEPASLVLTEDDILNFLVAVSKSPTSLPKNISNALKSDDKKILFLGFGFKYWYLRVLLHALRISSHKRSPSFALEQTIQSNIDDFNRTTIFYKESDYRIHLFQEDILEFSRLLKSKYVEDYGSEHPERVSMTSPDDSPKVFICHASEDKNKAAELHKKLKASGLNPWLDSQNIRGGDEWEELIPSVIKSIDYFLVLQSKALENKIGYVKREIWYALERKKDFGDFKFIFPVIIEECNTLKKLDHIHSIDISREEEKEFQKLVVDIKRDWERRKW